MLPAYAVAMTLGLRRHEALRRSRASIAIGVGAPLVALGFTVTNMAAAMRTTDAAHLAPAGAGVAPVLAAAFAPVHLREIANVVLALAPLALAAAAAAVAAAFERPRPAGDP